MTSAASPFRELFASKTLRMEEKLPEFRVTKKKRGKVAVKAISIYNDKKDNEILDVEPIV